MINSLTKGFTACRNTLITGDKDEEGHRQVCKNTYYIEEVYKHFQFFLSAYQSYLTRIDIFSPHS